MAQVTLYEFYHISLLPHPKHLENPIRKLSSLELYLKAAKNKHVIVLLLISLSPPLQPPSATNVIHFNWNPISTPQYHGIISHYSEKEYKLWSQATL